MSSTSQPPPAPFGAGGVIVSIAGPVQRFASGSSGIAWLSVVSRPWAMSDWMTSDQPSVPNSSVSARLQPGSAQLPGDGVAGTVRGQHERGLVGGGAGHGGRQRMRTVSLTPPIVSR